MVAAQQVRGDAVEPGACIRARAVVALTRAEGLQERLGRQIVAERRLDTPPQEAGDRVVVAIEQGREGVGIVQRFADQLGVGARQEAALLESGSSSLIARTRSEGSRGGPPRS
jgi:hypothetical protein